MMTDRCYSFLVIFVIISATCSLADGTVLSSTVPFTLSRNKTIVSHGDVFELGLFKPDSSSRDGNRWYLGIWFKKIPTRTYVWVANRLNPLSIPVGTIRVLKSNLVLFDQSDTVVWSTNVTGEDGRSPLVAKLLDNGNFVLGYSNASEYLWQSFDFPTDTLIPGMKLGWERRTGRYSFLRSWKDITDPSTGDFSYGIENQTRGFPALFIWSGSDKINRVSPWNGAISVDVPGDETITYLTFALTSTGKEASFSFQILDPKHTSILKMRSTGIVQQLWWNKTSSRWDLLWASLNDKCDLFQFCGAYGYCDISTKCNCMRGFEPKDPEAWALENANDGCVRTTSLSCNNDEFIRLSEIKLPDLTNATVEWDMGFSECKKRCLKDCHCTAFTTTLDENKGSRCVIWTGELTDVRQYIADGQDLYIRHHEKQQHDKKKGQKKLIIGLSVPLAFITIIISSICFFYWISNKRRAAKASVQENVVEDLELPLMSFETISIATDHFSASNKLGEGGFGMVYKGRLLDGQEIAVKRLSKVSGQGSDEFKNELTLITKVQHVNLVRLVGYSVNGDEKLLIYEFMENGSLDLYLFDETQSCNLNWSTRFEITKGIARGLLYLHQDSAILMIHRDLKPGNILLDKDMTPKISDFGMARIFGRGENNVNTAKVVGTYGYMSPEYAQDGTYSVKSDVFSFGVVMLEILSGKRNKGFARENDGLSLLSHAWTKWTKGEWACVIDPIVDPSSEEVKRCFQISLLCVQDRPDDRPNMSSVVMMLVSRTETIGQPHPPGYYYHMDGLSVPSSSNSEISTQNRGYLSSC